MILLVQLLLVQQKFDIITRMELSESESSGLKSFKCPFCDKRFSVKGQLPGHECIHTGDKPININFVRKDFLKKDT